MAGHSKWANIKHRKARQDAKREKIFTKHIRAITTAARINGDPGHNPRLRDAIQKALSDNMTREIIERARKKGMGGEGGSNMEEIMYEGYGPNGVAVLVECLTDNKNRTVGEVRHAFSKHGGNLGTNGSVSYLFKQAGQILFAPGADENKILEIALEAGAEDIQTYDDGSIEVRTEPDQFTQVNEALSQAHLQPEQAEITRLASTEIKLNAAESEKMLKLQEMLEDLDDVQAVYSNADLEDTASDLS